MRYRRGEYVADRRPEILAALRKDCGFVSAQGLHTSMKQKGIHIGRTAVYRALSAADAEGRLESVHACSGAKAYRYLLPVHENHLGCRVCGVGTAFFCQVLEDRVAQLGSRHGFEAARAL
ncbi:transcriptional repressor [Streptomyces clavifer]|uniref:transcriptional repressor n=1 Tax=Streptomyces clavifer TaxID=68188 RepID=UPI0033A012DD